jgi:hypothetical protein
MALLALVLGTRPPVTPALLLQHLHDHYGVSPDRVTVRRTRPDDFIVRFTNLDDLQRVLDNQRPEGAAFTLRWRRWSRLILGSAGAFRYRCLVGMKGLPSHARSTEVVQCILGSAGAKAEIANPDAVADPDDERELFVATWCAHPDLIPDEIIMAVPEPEEVHDGGSPLYLRPHEIIHDEVPALRYLVRLRIIEYQDWHTPPPSSDEEMDFGDDDSDSGDSNFNGYYPGFREGGSGGGRRRPRTTRFGRSDEPRLGPGSGPACRPRDSRLSIVVGKWECPVASFRGALHFPGNTAEDDAHFPRIAAQGGLQFDSVCPRQCSPSPVKTRAWDPMLVEACLSTPQRASSAGDVQAEKNSIDDWPGCGHDTFRSGRGLIRKAIDDDFELLAGRLARIRCTTGLDLDQTLRSHSSQAQAQVKGPNMARGGVNSLFKNSTNSLEQEVSK